MDPMDVEAILAQDVATTRLADKREFAQRMTAYLHTLDEEGPTVSNPDWPDGEGGER